MHFLNRGYTPPSCPASLTPGPACLLLAFRPPDQGIVCSLVRDRFDSSADRHADSCLYRSPREHDGSNGPGGRIARRDFCSRGGKWKREQKRDARATREWKDAFRRQKKREGTVGPLPHRRFWNCQTDCTVACAVLFRESAAFFPARKAWSEL